MAGYSKRTLAQKVGLRAGDRIALLDPPDGYRAALGPVLDEVCEVAPERGAQLDFIHCFSDREDRMTHLLPDLKAALAPDGMLWLSWPKKASGMPADLSGSRIRELGLAAGLVDVKVCAVDETWSGHKFVYRIADR